MASDGPAVGPGSEQALFLIVFGFPVGSALGDRFLLVFDPIWSWDLDKHNVHVIAFSTQAHCKLGKTIRSSAVSPTLSDQGVRLLPIVWH